jgi:CHAT domain-containing protein
MNLMKLMKLVRFFLAFFLGIVLTIIPQLYWVNQASSHSVGFPANLADKTGEILSFAAGDLVKEGRNYYEAGQYNQAVILWQEAINKFTAEGNLWGQAQVLNFLSLAYQKLGNYAAAREAIAQSKEIIHALGDREKNKNLAMIYAQILNTEGRLQFEQGNSEAAWQTWQAATAAYRQAGDDSGIIFSQINQARALESLGLYRRAMKLLEEVQISLNEQTDPALKSSVLLVLGDLLRETGSVEQSNLLLQEALAIADPAISPIHKSEILMSLGNNARILDNFPGALELYQQAETLAESNGAELLKIQIQLNQLGLLVENADWQKAESLAKNIPEPLSPESSSKLPESRPAIYAQVNLAKHLVCLAQKKTNCLQQHTHYVGEYNQFFRPINPQTKQQIEHTIQLVDTTVQSARNLADYRAESYAFGNLGAIYEELNQQKLAQEYTELGLNIAQSIQAPDIAYQWQWQLGRLLTDQGQISEAIAAYTEAVKTLKSLRSDLVAINQEIQFSFRESVEPLYRQLVELLIQPTTDAAGGIASKEISQENLKQARETIEALQLAELDNFFRDACLDAKPQQVDQVDQNSAVIYPMILPKELAVILSIPGQPLSFYQTKLAQGNVENTLLELQQSLNPAFSSKQRLTLSEQVYDWLIRPAELQLAENGVNTLVFVLDGMLRNLPMAALYDGQKYLVEKYGIALTPGLQLLEPSPLQPEKLKVLTGGLTAARQGFPALPGVESELQEITDKIPGENLLDQEFTKVNLLKQLERLNFPIVHLATHGQFSSNPEQTFILTWDDKLKVKEFENLLKNRPTAATTPIELLVLSACQTAAGDERAALGLAGVAVRSGARTTLATLWSVNDQSTARLVAEFYRSLLADPDSATQDGAASGLKRITKAEALRQAQLKLLNDSEYDHPYYWAPFVLVGNWL